MQTLMHIYKLPTYEAVTENGHVQMFVKHGLQMMTVLSQQPANQDFMMQTSFEIFLQICLPAIKITKAEREQFKDQSVEFVNSSSDVCSDMESETIKNFAAKLLLSLNKNVDGMQTFMIDFCLTMLENVVKSSNEQNQAYVNTVITRFNLVFDNQEHIIEVCLMIISILHKSFKLRQDLQVLLNQKFKLLVPVFFRISDLSGIVGPEFE